MRLSQFFAGCYFYTGTGRWMCLDIGSESIVAVRAKELIYHPDSHPADIENWDSYDLVVFYSHDFDGCSAEDDWNDD